MALALLTAPARAEPPALGNALAGERSLYLSGAASQPVHWQPWGERAFEAARRLRRPVLLDIGAAWCHWCHVFLLRLAVERSDGALLSMVTTTLDRMARGAIHDHVAGGFHRYAVDRGWRVPHFEKLMAPNAELLSVYLVAYQATGNPLYRDIAVDSAGSPKDLPAPIQAKLRSSASRGAPEAYVCARTLCSFPTGDAAAMAELIRSFGRPGWGLPREENAGVAGSR